MRPGHASIYLCGATVQGLPHIGHVRSGVAFDVLRRWLMAKGYDVAFIRNVTDIDDKILNKAADAGRPWWEWAATHERAFTAAYDALGVLPPSYEPRATGHITQIVELIERLIDTGHAYTGAGDVYFDVLSYPEYGALSGHRIDDVHQGEGAATGKRDQRDFTLWKGAKPGEPSWPTPWGRGRPGWHSECVAMAHEYLGAEFDIHCGGMDLVFPHHENEIAQARAAGDGFARYWLHNGWVTMGGEKMSKSLGNVLSIPAVLQRVRPAELRYYLGSAHYRSMLEFSETALQDAVKAYTGIEEFLHRVRSRVGAVVLGELDDEVRRRTRRRPGGADGAGRGARARAEGNRALDAGDHDAAMAHARSIRAMMGILGCDPLDERWESRDETSAALAAVDVLVRWALDSRAGRPRAAGLGAGGRDSRPPQGGGHRGHRHRRRAAVVPARRQDGKRASNGRQFAAPRRGAQGRHQEGPDGRVRRCAPPRARGQGRHAARARAAPPSGRQARQPRRREQQQGRPSKKTDDTEIVLGRNPVVECLRAGVPATALYVALGTETDERLTESVTRAADSGIAILEVARTDLDRMSTNGLHQGIALQVPPYDYAHPDDLLRAARPSDVAPALLVALDNISDPRNLGAIVRSVAAFGGHGVVIPQRRSASVTAVAWRTSAGAAARLPVARATNLTRTLKSGPTPACRWSAWTPTATPRSTSSTASGPIGRGRRLGGQGPVAAGPGELRRHRVDPDGRADGIAQRVGGRRRGARRDRPPAPRLDSARILRCRRLRLPPRGRAPRATSDTGTVHSPRRLNSPKSVDIPIAVDDPAPQQVRQRPA